MYTTASWRSIYEESINPISVPEDAWIVPSHVQQAKVLHPETRIAAGRRKKRRYETVEDKIRSSQGTQSSKRRKCSRLLKVTTGRHVIEQYMIQAIRHAIKAAFSVGIQAHTLTDDMYTTASWRSIYEESINPISVPEDAWIVPSHVQQAKVLPPETRRAAGRRKKRRYETVEDKIRSSQGTQSSKRRKCSRCGIEGHNRSTCDRAI
ncbi:hypothetical protein F2Q68_00034761 [Brassica cretica]|uniref:CCHC-type domain-containing protein n=1 Tax=Brassica cretica TaxID=69181 RepID=A0A8S9HAK2_BRACR|nr:hypothetical protein F2Q68_00034761 [Brassica cretica]